MVCSKQTQTKLLRLTNTMRAVTVEGFGLVLGGGINFVVATAMATLPFPNSVHAIMWGAACFFTSILVCMCVLARNSAPGATMQMHRDAFGSWAGNFRLMQLQFYVVGMAGLALSACGLLLRRFEMDREVVAAWACAFILVSCGLRVYFPRVLDTINAVSSWIEIGRWFIFLALIFVAVSSNRSASATVVDYSAYGPSSASETSALPTMLIVMFALAGVEGLMDQVGRAGVSSTDICAAMLAVCAGSTALYCLLPMALYGFLDGSVIADLYASQNYAGLTDVMVVRIQAVYGIAANAAYVNDIVLGMVVVSLLNGVTTIASWITDAVQLIGVHDAGSGLRIFSGAGFKNRALPAAALVAALGCCACANAINSVVQSTSALVLLAQMITTVSLARQSAVRPVEWCAIVLNLGAASTLLYAAAAHSAEDFNAIPATLITVCGVCLLPRVLAA